MPRYAYCVSCASGSEAALARDLKSRLPGGTAVYYPVCDREERKDGRWTTKTYPLLPGYLFVYSDTDLAPSAFYQSRRMNRLLCYTDAAAQADGALGGERSYPLKGGDLVFAQWVYDNAGHIKTSQAQLVGSRVEIVSGPLKYYAGRIKKVDKHKRSVLVTIELGETAKDVWLAFTWVRTEGTAP